MRIEVQCLSADGGALVLCEGHASQEEWAWAYGSEVGIEPAYRHRETYTHDDAVAVAQMVNTSSWITRNR